MRSSCSFLFSLAAMTLLSACDERSGAVLGPAADALSQDLVLIVPTALPETPVVTEVFDEVAIPDGPARSEHEGYGTYGESGYGYQYDYDYSNQTVAAGIWNAKTIAYFYPGQLSVMGRHDYIGNKAKILTEGFVAKDGTIIGSEDSYAEQSYPFLYPPWVTHTIYTQALIYTDTECGLSGWGNSAHYAWWEATLGGPSYNFSQVGQSTTAPRVFQPSCSPPPPVQEASYIGGGEEGLCYLWITYDIYSGEVYDQQLLFCTDGG